MGERTTLANAPAPGGARLPHPAQRAVVVAENHSVIGGLGEAVAGTLLRAGVAPPRFRQVAKPDSFKHPGAQPTNHDRYAISAEPMARTKNSGM